MKKRFSERVADAWGVPKDVIMNIPRMTVLGDKEVYIENHKGVAGYTENEVRISTAMGAVRIIGKNLTITAIRQEDVLVNGQFLKIEYEV